MVCYVRPALRRRWLASARSSWRSLAAAPQPRLLLPSTPVAPPSAELASSSPADGEAVVLVGRIVTMDEPPIAEALLIEDGLVAAVGTRDDVLALAGDTTPVIDIGENVAYPGFIDAHAHWIGDRDYYGLATPADAMDAALSRGWTSISEQWVNQERIDELERLAANDELPLRVDAYLALNASEPKASTSGTGTPTANPAAIDRLAPRPGPEDPPRRPASRWTINCGRRTS